MGIFGTPKNNPTPYTPEDCKIEYTDSHEMREIKLRHSSKLMEAEKKHNILKKVITAALILIITGCGNLQQSKGTCIDRALFCAYVCKANDIPVIIYLGDVNGGPKTHLQTMAYKDGQWRWQEMQGGYSVNINKYKYFTPKKPMTAEMVVEKWR